ncbi:hypothetical protein [Hyphomicrobium sp.]|uniref:hypothetical protein n=1 Tax=Hyphomicrobium sp. TaxID=82 RepID=UPI001D62D355|nr:hypothetical protein [Hyphomicrobium sp.]MBY0562427.1 hypothetical protein [Hyphomicrobium sp.]
MANFSSSDFRPYVIDTSVAINLEASHIAVEIFEALGRPVVIVDTVPAELEGGRGHGAKVHHAIADWQRRSLAIVVQLSAAGNETFESLIAGSAAATLDDGEAATIAHAVDTAAIAVIDEAKARKISAERFSALVVASSTDLILDPLVLAALGKDRVADGLFYALIGARMRVPRERHAEVVHLIGRERLPQCLSLPASVRRTT